MKNSTGVLQNVKILKESVDWPYEASSLSLRERERRGSGERSSERDYILRGS
jgi:hypothetical protein